MTKRTVRLAASRPGERGSFRRLMALRELTLLCLALAPVVAGAQELRPEAAEADFRTWAAGRNGTYERTGERPQVGEPPCWPEDPNRVHQSRHLTLSQDAAGSLQEIYVAGGGATIIRLPSRLAAG